MIINIAVVLDWKFPDLEGKSCALDENDNLVILAFPGAIPSQEDQDLWTLEYSEYIYKVEHQATIFTSMHGIFETGILWTYNQGEDEFKISLDTGMRETLSTFKQLIDAGVTNPHDGYLWSNGIEIRKPDEGDLSDIAIDEICIFAGQWSLAINRIAIQEKKSLQEMSLSELELYDPSSIDWSVTWDNQEHPDWIDNLVIQNP